MDDRFDVQINAYDPSGASSRAELSAQSRAVKRFALTSAGQPARTMLAPGPTVSLSDWAHADVGWGLVASANTTLPASIKDLVKERSAAVFRFIPNWERSFTYLRDEAENRDVAIAGSPRGKGPGRLPHYLMIFGGPQEVPWGIQFALAATRAVGRLPLTGKALDTYVAALRSDFKNAEPASPYTTVTWAVDLGAKDISHLMRSFIADKVQQKFLGDGEMGVERTTFLDGMKDPNLATMARLVETLKAKRPGLIVTTSHGLTGPLTDTQRMKETLGLPVDQFGNELQLGDLFKEWHPAGAVWYCHACCSAGAEAPSAFSQLFDEGTDLRRILDGIAKVGPTVAPLPLALLGHARPARAFIGHVEPTFDWTLRNPGNRQVVTGPLVDAIYPNLFRVDPKVPLGQAFREVHGNVGGYLADWDNARRVYDSGGRNIPDLMAMQLCARDLQSLVILGDPAAVLPLRDKNG